MNDFHENQLTKFKIAGYTLSVYDMQLRNSSIVQMHSCPINPTVAASLIERQARSQDCKLGELQCLEGRHISSTTILLAMSTVSVTEYTNTVVIK